MNKVLFKKILFAFSVFTICFLGYILRHHDYAQVPIPGESRDEISFAWLGLSLIKSGRPIATSGLDAYTHNWKYINSSDVFHNFANPSPFPIDSPWFDHPPLFSLLPGIYASTHGITQFSDISITLIRRPMLLLGTFNILLVIILAALLFNHRTALIAGLIYATNPLIVISSRLVQAENLLVSIFLLAIISYFLYRRSKNYFYFWLSISLSGLATLVKLSGVGVGLSLLLLNLISDNKDKFKKSLAIVLGTGVITLFFPLYGAFYDWSTFKNIFLNNSSRYFRDGLAGFYWLISKTNITRTFLDAWVLFAWMAVFFATTKLSRNKKLYYLLVPVLSYLSVYLIFGSEGYGWYKFPFYPFIFITLAWLFNYFLKKRNSFLALFCLLLPGGVMADKIFPPEKLQNYMWSFRFACLLLLFLIFLPSFKIKNFPQKKYSHLLIYFVFILCLLINILVNLHVDLATWYKIY